MPTYDYVCESCGHKWELFQSIKAEAERVCPNCKKKKAKRVIGPGAGIIFKGSGFYQTDYRSDSYKNAAQKESESTKPAAEGTKGSSDKAGGADKPAAAKESGGAKDTGAAKSAGKSPKSQT